MGWLDEGTRRQRRHQLLLLLVIVWLGMAAWGRFKPLPRGISTASPVYDVPTAQVRLLADVTAVDASGNRFTRQEIFDAVRAMISGAKRFVVLDFFLFNEYRGPVPGAYRDLTAELTAALLDKRTAQPDVPIVLITDPVNTVYGGAAAPELERLKSAGVQVVMTDLNQLRDSNPWYSGAWDFTARWLGNRPGGKLLANPFQSSTRVSLRSWLALLNFKANHRKVVIADRGSDVVSLVASFNPHTGSVENSNVAVEFTNGPWRELISSEQAVAAFSGSPFSVPSDGLGTAAGAATSTVAVQIATEGKIARAIEQQLSHAGFGDEVDVLMFYLADRGIVQALIDAAERGAEIRVILDPNKDAFGRVKDGSPNRSIAMELMLRSGTHLSVRWYDTHGEQAHSKMFLVRKADGTATLITGSANFTKRNLRDLNLETDVVVSGGRDADPLRRASDLFATLWGNSGATYTTEYATYRDESVFRSLRVRFMERAGMCSW
ncbi:MAG: phospholipase D-like domain-containing protein [Patescibacteria group bacterium]|nr:phospholipase D-like domain-containing protein [Patescibacteria group bacterium]